MANKVSNIIFQRPVIDNHHNFSTPKEIDDFFKNLPFQAIEKWPFNFEKVGLKTKYLAAKVIPETWKENAYCISINYRNPWG